MALSWFRGIFNDISVVCSHRFQIANPRRGVAPWEGASKDRLMHKLKMAGGIFQLFLLENLEFPLQFL